MTNQSKQRVTDAVNIALNEVRRATVNECEDAIWEQFNQYEKLLSSTEARVIFSNTYGEKFQALYEKRCSLRNKMMLLTIIVEKLYKIKYEKQEL